MRNRRDFLGALGVAIPVAVVALSEEMPRLRIEFVSDKMGDLRAWLDGVEITRDIPIRNERRFRRAKPGQVLTFTRYRRNANGAPYLEGGKVAADVVRAMVVSHG